MAIAYDAAAGDANSNSAYMSWTHTTGASLADSIGLTFVSMHDNAGPGAISDGPYWGDTNTLMTYVGGTAYGPATNYHVVWIYRHMSPAAGATTVKFWMSTYCGLAPISVTYSGVDQTSPIAYHSGGSQAPLTNFSAVVSSDAAQLVVTGTAMSNDTGAEALTPYTGQTSRLWKYAGHTNQGINNHVTERAGASPNVTQGYYLDLARAGAMHSVSLAPKIAPVGGPRWWFFKNLDKIFGEQNGILQPKYKGLMLPDMVTI